MKEIIGKWLLDVGKYIVTALILSRAFVSDDNSLYFPLWVGVFVLIMTFGLLLSRPEKPKQKKSSNRRYK